MRMRRGSQSGQGQATCTPRLEHPSRPHRDSYSHFVPEGVLANTLGVLLVAFGLVVAYVLTRDDWKRPPLAEEMALSMDFKTLTEGESPGGGGQ